MRLVVLLLLLTCSSQANDFYGTVVTYYPTNTNADGSVTVVLRYKLNLQECTGFAYGKWYCLSGNCGTESFIVNNTVDSETSGEFCQIEAISTRQVPTNAPFELWLGTGGGIRTATGIVHWIPVTGVEMRTRSDTGQANRSPQTTVLPVFRVPSNCQRDFNLLTFDPDGDEVKCRRGNASLSECYQCALPSMLYLSASCILSFRPNISGSENKYAVQLVMEDFPRQNVILTQTNGSQEAKTTNDAISKIPVQFILRVDPAVPSCTEGLYLPKFLPPTPANGAQLYIPVNETLEISIRSVSTFSVYSRLLFSGPNNLNRTESGPIAGAAHQDYILRWTPSQSEAGQSHPICFVVQAFSHFAKYQSDLRCVIASAGNEGLALLKFLPPTPANGTQLYTPVSQTLEISVRANISTISELLLSGPNNISKTTSGRGQYILRWTPSEAEAGQRHTICFVILDSSTKHRSELRCVFVTVGNSTTPLASSVSSSVVLRSRISSSSPLTEDDIKNTVLQRLKEELVRRGLPPDVTLRLVSSRKLVVTTTATPAGSP